MDCSAYISPKTPVKMKKRFQCLKDLLKHYAFSPPTVQISYLYTKARKTFSFNENKAKCFGIIVHKKITTMTALQKLLVVIFLTLVVHGECLEAHQRIWDDLFHGDNNEVILNNKREHKPFAIPGCKGAKSLCPYSKRRSYGDQATDININPIAEYFQLEHTVIQTYLKQSLFQLRDAMYS